MGELRMPSLGADMEQGVLVEWLVKPGDRVERGQIVATVETHKGLMDIEVFESGVVRSLDVPPGSQVPVGTVLARVEGSDRSSAASSPTVELPAPLPGAEPSFEGARSTAVAPVGVEPQGPKPKTPGPGPAPHVDSSRRPRASPAARRLAEELGVELGGLRGQGPRGVIERADVERAAARQPAKGSRDPTQMRKAIAAAMSRSHREIPHYRLELEVDVSPMLDWIEAQNSELPVQDRLLPGAVFVWAVCRAARKHAALNGFFRDGQHEPSEAVHAGLAIALRGGGLVAPAIHDAHRKTPHEIMGAISDLVERSRSGRLKGSEVTDPTLTITSLGDRGVDRVHGIIHPPQVSLVGFGRIRRLPWVDDEGRVTVRSVVAVTLAADHRVSDGREGGTFLRSIGRALAQPGGEP